jgi:hypothetical protein
MPDDERVKPEEEGSDVREMVWEMSRMTTKILILGIIHSRMQNL